MISPRQGCGGEPPARLLQDHRHAAGPVASRGDGCQTAILAWTSHPFPRELVRDLLGITRALFRAERVKPNPDAARVERLRQIGELYREALDMGTRYASDTMAGRAARVKAERATTVLGEFVAESELMAPAVAAAAERLLRVR